MARVDIDEQLARQVRLAFAEEAIRSGEVEIDGKTDEEVVLELNDWLLEFTRSEEPFQMQLDHSSNLLDEAERYHQAGDFDLALVLSATQLEHWLNYMIMWGCARNHGMEQDEAKRVVRQANLHVKTGWLWRLVFGDNMRPDLVARISAIAERRNAFVHYKWDSFDPDADDSSQARLTALATDAVLVIEELAEVENQLVFGGRRAAIAAAMTGGS